ncbi:MAG: hypothetical protein J7599_18085 [Niabella sp.]|nr:hypothetical protein [Niabella sp.]
MIDVVHSYRLLLKELPHIIDISGYKNEYVAKKLGMQPGNFSNKKQRGSWTADEVEKILKTISNEDVTTYLDELVFERCFPGNTVDSATFEKRMGWS